MSARTVSVRLIAEIAGYVSPLKAATQATRDLKTELSKAASEGKLDAVANSAMKMGLALSGGFLLATTAAARFEQAMSQVDAVANASASEMTALSEAAMKAGKDTQYSATEAAKAEAELAKAGLSASDILGGALTGSLSLAAAGGIDLAEAADTAAKAMNVFGLEGKDIGHIADVFAAAANKSATDVHELAFALKMGGLAAKNSNVSLEETVGTFAAFADNALVGSDAGTSFKQMLLMLAAPTDNAAGLMKDLGINAYDAQGKFIGIAGLADVLKDKLSGLTEQQRNAALATIFGSDAMRAATVLYSEGGQGIRQYTEAVNDEGAAAEAARKRTDNLIGDIEKLTGSLETLFIQSGSGANGGLRLLAETLGRVVDAVGSLPGPVLSVGTILIGLSGAGLLAFSAFVKVRNSVSDLMGEMRGAGAASGRFATGLETATKWAGRATAALVGMQLAGMAVASFGKDVNPQMKALTDTLADFGRTGKTSGEASRLFGKDLEDLNYDLVTLGSGGLAKAEYGFASFMEAIGGEGPGSQSITKAKERIASYDQALSQLVSGGRAVEAAATFDQLWQQAQKAGISLDDLKAAFPAYAAAIDNAGRAAGGMAGATGEADNQQVKLNDSLQESINKGHTLTDVWKGLHGAMQTADESLLSAKQSIDAVAKSFDDNGRSIDGNSRAALNNRVAMEDAASKAVEAAQAYYDMHVATDGQAAALDGATKLLDGLKREMVKATDTTGNARKQVQGLADDLYKLPPKTTVTANVVIGGTSQLNHVLQQLDRMTGDNHNRWGGAYTHAEDGVLREAAVYSPRSPARYAFAEPATKGEAFIPKSGDYGRSMGILQTAAGWYGAEVVPRQQQGWYGGGGGMGGTASYGGGGGKGSGSTVYNVNVVAAPFTSPVEIGATVVATIKQYEGANGKGWRS